jgi:hypothetical protein
MSNSAGCPIPSPAMRPVDADALAGRIAVELHVADGSIACQRA